jgi:hypothetical protein
MPAAVSIARRDEDWEARISIFQFLPGTGRGTIRRMVEGATA